MLKQVVGAAAMILWARSAAGTPVAPYYVTASELKIWSDSIDRMEHNPGALGDKSAPLRLEFYISGVFDAASPVGLFCSPSGMQFGQVFNTVRKYLNAHPDRGGEPGARVVIDALKEAFPCTEPSARGGNPPQSRPSRPGR